MTIIMIKNEQIRRNMKDKEDNRVNADKKVICK